jgi:preprotein translocase subunit YajC
MKRIVAIVTLLFALSLMALAHGNEKHVMGKVTSISDSSITVETTAKKSVTVEVSDKTKFEKSGAAATLKDLKVGDKVVIHGAVAGTKLVANEVHFGAMKGKQSMEGMKGMEDMNHK